KLSTAHESTARPRSRDHRNCTKDCRHLLHNGQKPSPIRRNQMGSVGHVSTKAHREQIKKAGPTTRISASPFRATVALKRVPQKGWLRHQENFGEAHPFRAAAGAVAYTILVSDHPVRSFRGGFAAFF